MNGIFPIHFLQSSSVKFMWKTPFKGVRCRIKLYGGNTVGRWNWKRNQYLAVFNFIWLGAQYRPTMPHRHEISLYVRDSN